MSCGARLAATCALAGSAAPAPGPTRRWWMRSALADRAAALALIKGGADVNQASPMAQRPLLWAVHNDDAELVRALIAAGADVEEDERLWRLACPGSRGERQRCGAESAARGWRGRRIANRPRARPPLMVVARTGNVEAAKLLLAHGAKVNAQEKCSRTRPP